MELDLKQNRDSYYKMTFKLFMGHFYITFEYVWLTDLKSAIENQLWLAMIYNEHILWAPSIHLTNRFLYYPCWCRRHFCDNLLSFECKWTSPNHIIGVMVRLHCGGSWVRAQVGQNQRLYNWYLLLLRWARTIKKKEHRMMGLEWG
jgi:hypothetical protein